VNRTSSCASVVYVPVQQLAYIPTIDSIRTTDAMACSAPFLSGIEVRAVSGGHAQPDQYTYEWTDLQTGGLMPQTIYRIKDSLASDYPLPAGRYRVRAFNEFNCPSDFLRGGNRRPELVSGTDPGRSPTTAPACRCNFRMDGYPQQLTPRDTS
jgi:hypothetical protein